MKKSNPALPEDAALANEFRDAVNALAAVMDRADRQGLQCGFSSISKGTNGRFVPQGVFVNKPLI